MNDDRKKGLRLESFEGSRGVQAENLLDIGVGPGACGKVNDLTNEHESSCWARIVWAHRAN